MVTRYPGRRLRLTCGIFVESLSEKDGRRYVAIEAEKLGYGGATYIAELFGCDPKTIQRGAVMLINSRFDEAVDRVRKKGRT